MPGKGKYTNFIGNKDKVVALRRFFKGGGPDYIELNEAEAVKEAAKIGNNILRAGTADGIVPSSQNSFWPDGVDLNYGGTKSTIQPPDLSAVSDKGYLDEVGPGAPMNAFTPDVSSPGPGKTLGVEKETGNRPDVEPDPAKAAEVKKPSATSPVVRRNNELGDGSKLTLDSMQQFAEGSTGS